MTYLLDAFVRKNLNLYILVIVRARVRLIARRRTIVLKHNILFGKYIYIPCVIHGEISITRYSRRVEKLQETIGVKGGRELPPGKTRKGQCPLGIL